MKNKLAVRNWHKIMKETRSEAEENVEVFVYGESGPAKALVDLLGPGSETVFRAKEATAAPGLCDLVIIVLAGNGAIKEDVQAAAKAAGDRGLEVVALIDDAGLADAAREAKKVEAEIGFNLSPGRISLFSIDRSVDQRKALLNLVADRLGDKALALAARVPSFRPLVVGRIINEISGQNAVIGAAGFIPASDMPALTANQIRMVLKIAAAFGATVSLKRAKELLLVVGGGFTFRAIARQLVGLVPIAGWAVKGAVAYTGTRALGDLAAKYFAGLEETD